jgi:creatinine amidohydrolase
MRLEDLNWIGVEKYLEQDDRLMLVLGACEQHGYLSLLTDAKIPLALADAASQKTGVLVAPAVNFGASPYFLKYPGTLSLRVSTLLDLLEDLVRSAYGQGFRRFLVLNGHGGNDAARTRLYELANQLDGVSLRWYAWWRSESMEAIAKKHGLEPYHASWSEAFSFTRVSDLPEGKKPPVMSPGIISAEQARTVYGDGVFGGDYEVGDEVMQELFEAVLEDVLQLLEFE